MKILNIGLMAQENSSWNKALRKTFESVHSVVMEGNWQERAISTARELKPEIIFLQIQSPGVISPDTAKELKKHGFVVNWTGDVRQPIPEWFYELAPNVHTTCFSNEHDVSEFSSKHPSDYLQIGIDHEIYRSGYEPIPCPEVVFMGNNYGHAFPLSQARRDMVAELFKHFGSKFAVYGNGWPQADSLMHSQPLEARVYNSAKVAINFNHYDLERFSSDRILRILGSGCFCLSQHYKGIEKDFTPGQHLDTFKDFADMIQKVSFYLNNDGKRWTIAQNGQRLCHKEYTFESMAENLIKIYESHKPSCES